MPTKKEVVLTEKNMSAMINCRGNGNVRHGMTRTYVPTLGAVRESVAFAVLNYDTAWPAGTGSTTSRVSLWDNGAISMDASTLAGVTVNLGTARWPQMIPIDTVRWYATSSSYLPISVLLILTRSKNYIFDPTKPDGSNYLYEIPLSAANAPTNGGTVGGTVPAGTYRYVVTEVSYHGAESPISTGLSVVLASDSDVTITKGTTVNTTAVRWRVYRSLAGDLAGDEEYRLVGEANIATTTITDSRLPSDLGQHLIEGRAALPAGVTLGCVHRGLVVTAGNFAQPSSIYVSDVAIDETGRSVTGYPEPSGYIAELTVPNGKQVTALVSLQDMLLAFTADSIEVFQGDITSTGYYRRTLSNSLGTENYRTVARLGDVAFFMDKSRSKALATDGDSVEPLSNEHLFGDIWYRAKGNQTIDYTDKLQGKFTAPLVVADPEHQCIMFGGELVSETYAASVESGTWSADALADTPQGNRQFAWRVFEIPYKTWNIWTNLCVRSYDVSGSKVWFGDHRGAVWQMKDRDAVDGPSTAILCTALVSASTGTTITLSSGTWAGAVTADSPVTVIDTSTGTMQFRYAVSATANTLVVDRATTVTSDSVVVYGVPVVDAWFNTIDGFTHLFEMKYQILPYSLAGRSAIIGLLKRDSSLGTWESFAKLIPQSSYTFFSSINARCPSAMLRIIVPAANAASSHMQTHTNLMLKNFTLYGTMIPKERF